MTGLSYGQYAATVVLANIAALLSCVGSSLICSAASKKLNQLYHRLLFALSVSDIFSSVGMFLHPYLMPHDTPNLRWASGNKQSCLAMGFCLVVFQMMVSCYSCFLSISFLFTIWYGWTEEKVHRQLERPAHAFAIVFSLFIGISGIATEAFLPTVFINTCWIGGCSLYHLYEDGACPEEEINFGWVLGWVFVGVLTINTVVASISVQLVRRAVRVQTRSNRAISFRGNISQQSETRQREVVWQAVMYTCIYVNT